MKHSLNPELKRLQIKQLDDRLRDWAKVRNQPRPRSGWISATRGALGMGLTQLGQRLGTTPIGVKRLEQREVAGRIFLESLSRAAQAMGCELVYAIVPKTSLESILDEQVRKKAREQLGRVDHTMRLEAQEVGESEIARQEAALVQRLAAEWPRKLWDHG